MATRAGVELSPSTCRIVEIDAGRRRQPGAEIGIRSFAVAPRAGAQAHAALRAIRGRSAAVVVWGAAGDHRQVVVSERSYERMRREALAALNGSGITTHDAMADVAVTPVPPDLSKRRPVIVTLAAASAVDGALQPLLNAGVRVEAVMTPAAALASLARGRHEFAIPGTIEAYVALEDTATCIALMRDGVLLRARELAWGFSEESGGRTGTRRREDIAARLGDELSEFFAAVGASSSQVTQVCICGGLPELRSMTLPLMERLDVEVEPLDSLFGIDASRLPASAHDLRERMAELRVAWAAVADWPPQINLLRARRRRATRVALSRAAAVAAVATGLGLGWRVLQNGAWRSAPAPVTRAASNTRPPSPPLTSAPASRPQVQLPEPLSRQPIAPPMQRPPERPAPPPPMSPPASNPALAPSSSTATRPTAAQPTPPTTPARLLPAPATSITPATRPAPTPPTTVPAPSQRTHEPPAVTATPVRLAPASPPAATSARPIPPAPAVATPLSTPTLAAPPRTPLSSPQSASSAAVTAALPRPTSDTSVSAAPPRSAPVTSSQSSRSTPAAPVTSPAVRPTPSRPLIPPSVQHTPPASLPTTAAARPAPIMPSVTRREEPPLQGSSPSAGVAPRVAERSPTEVRRESQSTPERARPAEPVLPFQASLGTILYSPDRRLAIIDGRIVGIGDEVRGARITDITQTAVLLRDAQGRLRRLTLGAGGR